MYDGPGKGNLAGKKNKTGEKGGVYILDGQKYIESVQKGGPENKNKANCEKDPRREKKKSAITRL